MGHLNRVRQELRELLRGGVRGGEPPLAARIAVGRAARRLYLWVRPAPTRATARELYVTAIQHGVAYAIGTLFYTDGGGGRHIRLNFAAHPPARIEEGFRRLSAAWQDWQQTYAPAVRRAPIL